MRVLLFFLLGSILLSGAAQAQPGQWLQLGTQDIWIGAPGTPGDVERAMMSDLTGVMRKFYPAGKGISKYKANGSGTWTRMTFTAAKKIGPFTKNIDFVGTASRPGRSSSCDSSAVNSYYLEFSLDGSDSIVTDNAWAFGIDMCVVPKGDGSFFIKSKTWLKEGGDFGGASAKSLKSTVAAQAWPMLVAVSKKVEEYSVGR